MERIRGFLFGGGRNAITDDNKVAPADTNNRDEERGISEKEMQVESANNKPSKSSAEEVADDVDSLFKSSSDDDDGRESSQASGGKKKKSGIGKKVEDRPPVAVVVAKSKKAAAAKSDKAKGSSSYGKPYMCRLCNLPVKGHKCPHKSRPGRKRKTTAEDESTTPKSKRSRAVESLSDASSNYDSPSSAHSGSGLLLLQGAAMSVLEEGARQPGSDNNTKLELVNDPRDDSSWVDDAQEEKERDDHSDRIEQASFISVTKKAASSASTKVGRRSTYSCALCGLPLKGHVCPYRKNSTANKRKYGTSTDDTDHGERLSVLTAAAGYSEETEEEAWTEIMAPAHILQDEIHSYIVRQTREQQSRDGGGGGGSNHRRRAGMTDNEKTFLQSWSDEAYSQFVDQNELIAENLDLSDARKKMAKKVSKERGKSCASIDDGFAECMALCLCAYAYW